MDLRRLYSSAMKWLRARSFYGGILGFEEIWRGSAASSPTLSWVNMRVPDGTDYLEFMALRRGARPRPPRHRASFVSAGAGCREGCRRARLPRRAQGVRASDRGPHRYQPQAAGESVRSGRDTSGADGARGRQTGPALDAAAIPLSVL